MPFFWSHIHAHLWACLDANQIENLDSIFECEIIGIFVFINKCWLKCDILSYKFIALDTIEVDVQEHLF